MLDKETRMRLADYFSGAELIEYLEESKSITTMDVIGAFEDEIEEALDDLYELMGVNDD